jgi:hypothetical protein
VLTLIFSGVSIVVSIADSVISDEDSAGIVVGD